MQLPANLLYVFGPSGSGKDTIGEHLAIHKGFWHGSVSDTLRSLHAGQSANLQSPATLGEFGAQLRQSQGADILIQETLRRWQETAPEMGRVVLTGHASIEEARSARNLGATLIHLGVVTPEMAFQRRQPIDAGTPKETDLDAFQIRYIRELYGLNGQNAPFDIHPVSYFGDQEVDASQDIVYVLADVDRIVDALAPDSRIHNLTTLQNNNLHRRTWQDEEAEGWLTSGSRAIGEEILATIVT